MAQFDLFGDEIKERIVNVASVPQRSPFRYPGGKTWLIPRIRKWLRSFPHKPAELIEPFAGGGIVSLTAAFENLCDRVLMIELDEQVAAVWKTIFSGESEWLAHRIEQFELTHEKVVQILTNGVESLKEKAFQTILKNRVFHGGILAPGSGLLKNGENGKGIKSRWYPQTLSKRIRAIEFVKDRIQFIEGDGMEIMRKNAHRTDAVFFIDPPYTAAGKKAGSRLYSYNELDHEELFAIAEQLSGPFLMTYDNAEGVMELARKHGFAAQTISMKNTHHAQMTELLISRNLKWNL